jgi:hypothetical protein
MADSLKDILVGIIKKDYVNNEILSNRKTECGKCEYNLLGQCLECNCLLIVKQKLTKEQCPKGRW